MTTPKENEKNKSKLGTKSKILVLGLMLVALVGLFGLTSKVSAQATPPPATTPTPAPAPTPEKKQTQFEQQFDTAVICSTGAVSINVGGCLVSLSYYLFYKFPAFLLTLTAEFFNTMVGITLSSILFAQSDFIPTGWGVVRDLSNLFFILALLYIAIKIILGIDTSGAKKMIGWVIITAMLINFSMFFTEVVIDTSNVLALIFYNKMQVDTINPDGKPRPYKPLVTESNIGFPIKDISGGMVNAFNPTSQLVWDNFFKEARTPKADGSDSMVCKDKVDGHIYPNYTNQQVCESGYFAYARKWVSNVNPGTNILIQVPSGIMMALILITGAIMLFACYAFLWAGLAFMGRLIELWVLIIFSPFAFVSFAVPILNEVPYIGWSDWSKRLLKTAFMAPIFMFFMYLIFMLVQAKLFNNLIEQDQGMIGTLLLIGIPALVILILLLKATEYAKKGSGQFGEIAMKGLKLGGGLALAAATGGTAMLATGAIGSLAAKAASSKFLNDKQKDTGFGGMAARMALKTANYGTKASFDLRKLPGMSGLAKATGINMETGKGMGLGIKEGGYEKRRKDKEDKEIKRAKEFEVKENEPFKQKLNKTEADLQSLMGANEEEVDTVDKLIEKKRKEASDAERDLKAASSPGEKAAAQKILKDANSEVAEAKKRRENLRNGITYIDPKTKDIYNYAVSAKTAAGGTIDSLEKQKKTDTRALKTENRQRQWAAADRLEKKWTWGNTNRATAHKVRMNAKVEEKPH